MRKYIKSQNFGAVKLFVFVFCIIILFNIINIPQFFIKSKFNTRSCCEESKEAKIQNNPGINYEFEFDRLWNRTVSDFGRDIEVDSNNNSYIAGSTNTPRGAVLLKYDSEGNLLWNATWNSQPSNLECYGVAISDDSAYLTGHFLNGTSNKNKIFIAKYFSNGTFDWERYWGDNSINNYVFDIVADSHGDISIVGYSWDSSISYSQNITVTKFYSNSSLAWSQSWDGLGQLSDIPNAITIDANDNIYITGSSYGDTDNNIITLKYDSIGILKWEKYWNGTLDSVGEGIITDINNNVYVVGRTNDTFVIENDMDAVILKYNASGVQLWERRWGMSNNDERFTAVTVIRDKIYCLGMEHVESYDWDNIIVEYDSYGNNPGHLVINGSLFYQPNAQITTDGSNLYLVGRKYDIPLGDNDILFVKCRPIIELGNIFIEVVNETFTQDGFNITFHLIDENNNDVIGALIRYWWDGIEFTGNMTEFSGGLYLLNFTVITVLPDENPILLNMTITKSGYTVRYYEKEIAVDPESIKAGDLDDTLSLFDKIIQFIISPGGIIIIIGIIAGVVIVIVIIKKKH
ncbi:MAG: SBBP repeat-containing protein [Promethearchaeota archaeon]